MAVNGGSVVIGYEFFARRVAGNAFEFTDEYKKHYGCDGEQPVADAEGGRLEVRCD